MSGANNIITYFYLSSALKIMVAAVLFQKGIVLFSIQNPSQHQQSISPAAWRTAYMMQFSLESSAAHAAADEHSL
jgi:hypothetical protein